MTFCRRWDEGLAKSPVEADSSLTVNAKYTKMSLRVASAIKLGMPTQNGPAKSELMPVWAQSLESSPMRRVPIC
jgi:hypothetical protein